MTNSGGDDSRRPAPSRHVERWRILLVFPGVMWIAETLKAAGRSPYTVRVTPLFVLWNAVFVALFFVFPAFVAGARYAEWARRAGRSNRFIDRPHQRR